jgi:hypothetical protein
MRILLSRVRVIARHALIGVGRNLYFRGLLSNRLRRWVSIFDPCIRENRRANFLRLQEGVHPSSIAATPSVPIQTVLGNNALKLFMANVLPSFESARLLPPDAAGLERPCIVKHFSHTPPFLPMHTTWKRNEQKVNA